MTDPVDPFDALRLPVAPLAPRPALITDLRDRLHRRLGFGRPAGTVAMREVGGIEYETRGREDGEAVLFIHAGTATAYQPLMTEPALAEGYQLVRYHRRGYAGSTGGDGEFSIQRHVADALDLLDHLAIDRAHVVGHSGSGIIALEIACTAPHRVRSLVLEEPAIHAIDPGWDELMRDRISFPVERFRAGDHRGAIEMWMQSISPAWRADLTRTVAGGPQQMVEDAATFFADVGDTLDWAFDRARVASITVPVLYLLGSDASPPAAVLRRFRDVVPQTEVAVIPGATHMLHTDRPELVAAELDAFFARHSAPS